MSQTVQIAEQQIKDAVTAAAAVAVSNGRLPAGQLPPFILEIPQERSHGDYAVNAALASAKVFRLPPRKIAEILCENISTENTFIDAFEVAGPGFINFRLSDRFYSSILKEVETRGAQYGRSDFGQGKRVLVEFVSANPTGPMHIGNARGGALGDCLASVLDAAGYQVSREFYVNDAGNQIEKFKTSLEARYLQLFDPSVQMPEDAYLGEDITEHAKRFAAIHQDAYVHTDSETRRQALCDYALPLNIQTLHDDLAKYRITYDCWFKESSLHQSGAVAEIIEKLKASGHT